MTPHEDEQAFSFHAQVGSPSAGFYGFSWGQRVRSWLSASSYLILWLLVALCMAARAQGQVPATSGETSTAFSAAGIGTGTRPITGLWQFHFGDDLAWAQPGFDDRGWERLSADQPWGDLGHPRTWGYAWYRREIALDPHSKQPLAVLLPPLDSAVEVYWNGVKIGSEGSMPPHPDWFNIPQPVAVALPPITGASSGVLALRMWACYRDVHDVPDASGLQGPLLLGNRSLIQKMPDAWTEHRFRTRGIGNLSTFLCLIAGVAALVLWLRSRSQWVLLWVALYFGAYFLSILTVYLLVSVPWTWATGIGALCTLTTRLSSAGLILSVADLPRRAGVRGFRFWARACVAVSCLGIADLITGFWHDRLLGLHYFTPTQSLSLLAEFLIKGSEFVNPLFTYGFPLFTLVLLAACLVFSRRTLPRVLFMVASALDNTLQYLASLSSDATGHLAWIHPMIVRPLLTVYGSTLSKATTTRMLVLAAVVYAVWDQLSQQLARQRFVNAELHAAHEIQQVLVPAAMEREAPGYVVSSVYRPASEVGGDFFQVVSLEGNGTGDGTLIVAGDVSGKGLRAAMTVSLVVGALRTLAEYDPEPAAILAGLNRRLIGRTQGGFVTCCAIRIDSTGHAIMANAGHCQPYIDGREIELPNGLPLGIVEDVDYEEVAVQFTQGQQLTLLSDGVVEARNQHGELYGFDRLNHLMQQRPTPEHVADTAVRFGQDDDITVLTVTRLATT